MRGIYLLLCICLVHWTSGQSLDVIELGHLAGEMEHFESSLEWKNMSGDTVAVKLWSSSERLTFSRDSLRIIPGETFYIPYRLSLTETKGEEQYEVRLITNEDLVVHGWLLKARIFEAETDVFKTYRNVFYPFRTTSEVLNLKAGFAGEELSRQFSLYNFGGKDLDLTAAYTSDPQVSVTFEPAQVRHNAFTRLTVRANSTATSRLGFTRKRLQIFKADSSLLATIPLQYTLERRPESSNGGPHLTLSMLSHDFKVMSTGEQEAVEIILTNTGHSPLLIEQIESNCDCLEHELGTNELATGESTQLTVRFNATGRQGYERKTLAIFSNDPDQPTRVLTFRAHVK